MKMTSEQLLQVEATAEAARTLSRDIARLKSLGVEISGVESRTVGDMALLIEQVYADARVVDAEEDQTEDTEPPSSEG